MTRVRIWENIELSVGCFSWLLRVIDHEKQSRWTQSFVLKLGSQVSGVVETGVWTADTQPVALLAKK
jgi:hypothetical protein